MFQPFLAVPLIGHRLVAMPSLRLRDLAECEVILEDELQ